LIDIVRWAPTAMNLQPVEWIIIANPDETRRMAGKAVDWMRRNNLYTGLVEAWDRKARDEVLRGAPHAFIAHAHEEGLKPVEDCTIALTYLELAAWAQGLGACWAGAFTNAINHYHPLASTLNLPERHRVYGAMMIGYPDVEFKRIPPRNDAKIKWM
jgi:nitroreductase